MAEPEFSGALVVGLRLRIDAENSDIRCEATVESYVGGRRLYQEQVAYKATWAEILTFLGGLLATEDANRPVGSYLSLALA